MIPSRAEEEVNNLPMPSYQLDMFAIAANVSTLNSSGVFTVFETLAMPGRRAGKEVEILIAWDGMDYHWATNVFLGSCGFGSHPSPKWKQLASSRCQAIERAAGKISKFANQNASRKECAAIKRWLSSINQ